MKTTELQTIQPAFDLAIVPEKYQAEGRRFLAFVEEHGFTIESYQRFIAEIRDHYKPATTNKYIAACRAIIRATFNSPSITDLQRFTMTKALETVPYVKLAASEKQIAGVLTESEIDTLVAGSTKRTGLLIRFLAATGCRISEMTGAKLANCTVEETKVHVQIVGKGDKARTVRVSRALYNDIRDVFSGATYLFESKTGNPLHNRNVAKEIHRSGLRNLGKSITPHDFRHAFATRMGKQTHGNWKGVSDYLGHQNVQTTLDMYVHNSLTDADLGL